MQTNIIHCNVIAFVVVLAGGGEGAWCSSRRSGEKDQECRSQLCDPRSVVTAVSDVSIGRRLAREAWWRSLCWDWKGSRVGTSESDSEGTYNKQNKKCLDCCSLDNTKVCHGSNFDVCRRQNLPTLAMLTALKTLKLKTLSVKSCP